MHTHTHNHIQITNMSHFHRKTSAYIYALIHRHKHTHQQYSKKDKTHKQDRPTGQPKETQTGRQKAVRQMERLGSKQVDKWTDK